ncbi:MAG: hypothetical protein N2Z79_00935 [Candidatus Omnitrophica bacterium]|nr:hypothetical protein [Candidatus Omnitrophota bacterium]
MPPFSTCDGHPARVYGLNLVGLRRHGIPSETIRNLDKAFKILFNSGLSLRHAIEEIRKNLPVIPEITYLIDFVSQTKRGIARSAFNFNEIKEPLASE